MDARLVPLDLRTLQLAQERLVTAQLRAELARRDLDAVTGDLAARYQLAPADTVDGTTGAIVRAPVAAAPTPAAEG